MPDIVVAFFALGVVAGLAKSDLKVPQAAYDTLSILLMLTIGFKGGLALHGHMSWRLVPELLVIAGLGVLIPLLCYPLCRRLLRLDPANSASIAAHYGSVSAGTFAVALAYVESRSMTISPQTTLYLVLLELPAIVVAIYLYKRLSGRQSAASNGHIWHEALTSRGVVLLTGGVLIGYFYGPEAAPVSTLFLTVFKGLLALFLLEMGLCAAKALRPVPWRHWRLMLFAVIAPLGLSLIGILASAALGLPLGTALILTGLTASASYIAAPAAIGGAIKEADIGLAMLAALAVTFPFNVILGIPLYHQILNVVY
ncbi:sodium-dependent bicarbonate transport family permease [Zobellella aerophila]|uniref:Sodium-dependent bicarbonate transport family permease n=1 Tax=Zobellella aerophila TaxID=870480 RepID=A0ABP6V1G0_9GAMM